MEQKCVKLVDKLNIMRPLTLLLFLQFCDRPRGPVSLKIARFIDMTSPCIYIYIYMYIYIYIYIHANTIRSLTLSALQYYQHISCVCGSSSSYLVGVDTALHDDVIKWKPFRVTGHLWGESTGFPSQMPVTRRFEIFIWSAPEQKVEQTIETLVIWDAITLIMTSLQCCSGDICRI